MIKRSYSMLEAAIAVGLFALICAGAAIALIKTAEINAQAADIDRAAVIADSIAERFSAGYSVEDMFYDGGWNEVSDAENARFMLALNVGETEEAVKFERFERYIGDSEPYIETAGAAEYTPFRITVTDLEKGVELISIRAVRYTN